MCRRFGMTSGAELVSATFWLLDAPAPWRCRAGATPTGAGSGSLIRPGRSSTSNPSRPFGDAEFLREAKQASSTTFVAHVRWATTGGRTPQNTHPFAMRGRIMAHNGGFGDIGRLDEQLGPYRELVLGDTDSERYFALITQQIDAHGGDVGAGLTAAARWIGDRLPVSSLNTIVAAPGELWALRYPGQHALHIIERPAGASIPASHGTGSPADAPAGLHVRSATSSVHAPALQETPTVVVASEELDGEEGWRMLADGELVRVSPDLTVTSAVVIPEPPAHLVPLPQGSPNIDT